MNYNHYLQRARELIHNNFAENEDSQLTPAEAALFVWAKAHVEPEAMRIVDAAHTLLMQVDSLEQFRERLIDVFHIRDPEGLALALAKLEALSTLAGMVDAHDEIRV